MQAILVVRSGRSAGQRIVVRQPVFLIGRAEGCHLRPQSLMVAERHCEITVGEARVSVRDLGSRAGTLVNGQPIDGARELRGGDRLTVGPLEFEVQLDIPIGGPKKPKVRSIGEAAARSAQLPARRDQEELDIAGWIDEDEDAPSSAASGAASASGGSRAEEATGAKAAQDRSETTGRSGTGGPGASGPASASSGAPSKSGSSAVRRFVTKPSSASSSDAAAELLRRGSRKKP